jgi:hypothetical protein
MMDQVMPRNRNDPILAFVRGCAYTNVNTRDVNEYCRAMHAFEIPKGHRARSVMVYIWGMIIKRRDEQGIMISPA